MSIPNGFLSFPSFSFIHGFLMFAFLSPLFRLPWGAFLLPAAVFYHPPPWILYVVWGIQQESRCRLDPAFEIRRLTSKSWFFCAILGKLQTSLRRVSWEVKYGSSMTQPPCHPDGAEFREDNIYQPAFQTAERGNNCKERPGPCQLDLCPSSKTQDYFTSARKRSSASS